MEKSKLFVECLINSVLNKTTSEHEHSWDYFNQIMPIVTKKYEKIEQIEWYQSSITRGIILQYYQPD